MKTTSKIHLLIYLLLYSITFIFIANANTDKSQLNSLEGDMIYIPAGSFIFGTNKQDSSGEALSLGLPKPWYIDEGPEQNIFLKAFYIDRYEVTNHRYKIYIDDLNAVAPRHWENNKFPDGQGEFPVVNVTWYDASNFCQWAEKKLPSEKQWEKAARGEAGSEYPWGREFQPNYANLSKKSGSKNLISPVGSYPRSASPLGVHDLVGNVWEWIRDDYSPYRGSTYKSENFSRELKVLRGQSAKGIGHFPGAAYLSALKMFSRSSYREFSYPDRAELDVGFRCANEKMPPAMKLQEFSTLTQSEQLRKVPKSEATTALNTSPSLGKEKGLPSNPFEVKTNLPTSGMLVLIFLAFVAGLFSFLSPCTLPILPAYFAVTAQADRTRMGFMSIAFFLGLASLFVGMGASASFFGSLLREYMFSLTTAGGVAVVIFGIMTLFGKGFSGAGFQGRPTSTFVGFFLFGATFALGWTPCVGPILSGILILAASDKTILQGMALLFFYAVGLGLPLILIATLCSNLPKDGLFWKVLRGKGWNLIIAGQHISIHSTNIFSGLLLIVLGSALIMGYITYINSLIPIEIQIWFSGIEEIVLHMFSTK
jgi:formylglycine-generating enzyme required for sulfatase activity/cytochrome c biogenesis protein CcdA